MRSIPQSGHLPGPGRFICGCIEHVQTLSAFAAAAAPSAGATPPAFKNKAREISGAKISGRAFFKVGIITVPQC
jgi:hypothetical protein